MSWGTCFTHATLSILSYVAFATAAVGGGTYLFVEWYKPLRELENFREEMQSFRLKTNLIYMSLGIIALGVGTVLGAIQAKAAWGSYWSWEAKQNTTIITWTYYLVAAGLLAAHFKFPDKHLAKISSALAIGGVPLILLNGLVINFFVSALHKYL
ncbi:MAG: cytochrome c biogenesis protein CcsA [Actinobacteria bacterium]|nr:cytochrome c biogenesis protein CcsA [Actinomycetota bacterium]